MEEPNDRTKWDSEGVRPLLAAVAPHVAAKLPLEA